MIHGRRARGEGRRVLIGVVVATLIGASLTLLGILEREPDTTADAASSQLPAALAVASRAPGAPDEVPVPDEVRQRFRSEIDDLDIAYPPAGGPKGVSQLVPGLAGARVASVSDNEVVLVNESTESQYVIVVRKGQVSVAAVSDWQCQWVGEYLDAKSTNDQQRMEVAASELLTLPNMSITTREDAAKLLSIHEEAVLPMLDGNDGRARAWHPDNCQP